MADDKRSPARLNIIYDDYPQAGPRFRAGAATREMQHAEYLMYLLDLEKLARERGLEDLLAAPLVEAALT